MSGRRWPRRIASALAATVLLAGIGLVGTACWAHHRFTRDLAEYQQLRARHQPRPPTIPICDEATRAEWTRWITAIAAIQRELGENDAANDDLKQWRRNGGNPPAKVRLALAAHVEDLARLRAFLARHPALSDDAVDTTALSQRLQAIGAAARLLADSARASADPGADLRALDDLLATAHASPFMLSQMFAMAVGNQRDDAYLAAAMARRDPADLGAAWLAERDRQLGWFTDAIASERDGFAIPRYDHLLGLDADAYQREVMPAASGWDAWWSRQSLPAEALGSISALDAGEARMRELEGKLTEPKIDPSGWYDPQTLAHDETQYWLASTANQALLSATRERLRRAAAMALHVQEESGELPADEAALAQAWTGLGLDAGQDRLRLHYERLGPDRFRVSVDPATPTPEFVPTSQLAGSGYGKPAGPLGMSRDGTTLELWRPTPQAPWAIQ
jgi:hypothetical protein